MSEKFSLNSGFNWLIWSMDKPSQWEMKHSNLNIDSEVTWATPKSPDGSVMLYDIYKINYTWPMISTFAGQWDRVGGLTYSLTQFKYSRRGDLQGLHFSAVVAVRRWSSNSALRTLEQENNKRLYNF
jgi:hypothetical protein